MKKLLSLFPLSAMILSCGDDCKTCLTTTTVYRGATLVDSSAVSSEKCGDAAKNSEDIRHYTEFNHEMTEVKVVRCGN